MIDWQPRIVELTAIKQRIRELDTAGLWPHSPPNAPATEAELVAAEAALGEPLDQDYRQLLSHVAGWPAFWQSSNLFGPDDLRGSERHRDAVAMLDYIEDLVLEQGGLRRADLLPIAASPVDPDLFVMTRKSAPAPGIVVWLAGGEIERYPGFEEYFLAMVELNRMELLHFQTTAGGAS